MFNFTTTQSVVIGDSGEVLELPCEVNYLYIDNNELCVDVCNFLKKECNNPDLLIAVDVETNGFDVFTSTLFTIQIGLPDNRQFIFDIRKLNLQPLKEVLELPFIKAGHNFKFDATFINYNLNTCLSNFYDSFLAELLYYLGDHNTIGLSLDDVMERRLGVKLQLQGHDLNQEFFKDFKVASAKKRMQRSFEKLGPTDDLSPAQLAYAAQDVSLVLFQIIKSQIKDLKKQEPNIIFNQEFYDSLRTESERQLYLQHFPKTLSLWGVAQLEFKFLEVVVDMELKGMCFDTERHQNVLDNLLKDFSFLRIQCLKNFSKYCSQKTLLGVAAVNLESPEQVLRVLRSAGFPQLESTDSKEIENLFLELGDNENSERVKILKDFTAYKKIAKLVSAFGESLQKTIHPVTQKVHPSIKQTVDTGRMASKNPNIQQIPRKIPWAKRPNDDAYNESLKTRYGLRECFKAAEGHQLIIMDYGAQEMCIAACVSLDPSMITAINEDKDLHCYTVSIMENEDYEKVFLKAKGGVTEDKSLIEPEWAAKRQSAKTASFGSLYGAGAWNLAQQLRVSFNEAAEILDKYWASYPRLAESMPTYGRQALVNSYSNTLLGRRRYYEGGFRGIKKIKAYNLNELRREVEEHHPYLLPVTEANMDAVKEKVISGINKRIQRQAGNHVIQGTAGDMMKKAAVYIYNSFKLNKINARIVALVHDEVVVEAPNELLDECLEIVKSGMLKSFYDFCPFVKGKVEGHTSPHWLK